jgi:hypothetical protein
MNTKNEVDELKVPLLYKNFSAFSDNDFSNPKIDLKDQENDYDSSSSESFNSSYTYTPSSLSSVTEDDCSSKTPDL